MKNKNLVALLTAVASLCLIPKFGPLLALTAFVILSAVLAPRESTCFVNNFGVLTNTICVFDAFSQFLESLLPLRNLILDTQDEKSGIRQGKPGETITLKDWRTSAPAYQPAPTYAATDLDISAGDRTVTLPITPWAVSIKLTAAEYRVLASGDTAGAGYMTFRNKLANLMINSLGKKMIDLWFATITQANFPDVTNRTVNTVGNMNRATEIDLDTALFSRNVPTLGAQLILTPVSFAEWSKDHIQIQSYTNAPVQKTLLVQGGIQSANSNFQVWRTNRPMPANTSRGFASTQTGVVAAFRVPDEATFEQDPVSLSLLIDPVTDIPMLARLWKNAADGSIQFDIATLPVFAKGQTEAMQRIEII